MPSMSISKAPLLLAVRGESVKGTHGEVLHG